MNIHTQETMETRRRAGWKPQDRPISIRFDRAFHHPSPPIFIDALDPLAALAAVQGALANATEATCLQPLVLRSIGELSQRKASVTRCSTAGDVDLCILDEGRCVILVPSGLQAYPDEQLNKWARQSVPQIWIRHFPSWTRDEFERLDQRGFLVALAAARATAPRWVGRSRSPQEASPGEIQSAAKIDSSDRAGLLDDEDPFTDALRQGLTHYNNIRGNELDFLTEAPSPCTGCGVPLVSYWVHVEDRGINVRDSVAEAWGFKCLPDEAAIAESDWLCESCLIESRL